MRMLDIALVLNGVAC
ncbi:hypothetical protein LINGRAHAP2_LOCUS1969 [Linum grandiflorum]